MYVLLHYSICFDGICCQQTSQFFPKQSKLCAQTFSKFPENLPTAVIVFSLHTLVGLPGMTAPALPIMMAYYALRYSHITTSARCVN